eukprot:2827155-Amphidinium_carterae.1
MALKAGTFAAKALDAPKNLPVQAVADLLHRFTVESGIHHHSVRSTDYIKNILRWEAVFTHDTFHQASLDTVFENCWGAFMLLPSKAVGLTEHHLQHIRFGIAWLPSAREAAARGTPTAPRAAARLRARCPKGAARACAARAASPSRNFMGFGGLATCCRGEFTSCWELACQKAHLTKWLPLKLAGAV